MFARLTQSHATFGAERFARGAARAPTRRVDRVADWALLCVLFVAPLALGGRQDHGGLVYVACCGVAATAAAIASMSRGRPSRSWGAIGVFSLGLVVLATQLAPLPESWIAALTGGRTSALPLWSGDAGPFGVWNTVSVTPTQTRHAIVMWLAHAALFYAAVARLRDTDDVRWLLTRVGMAAVAMTMLALAGKVIGNGRLLNVYDYPAVRFGEDLQGTFTNRNHFAHFLLLGVWALPLAATTTTKPLFKRLAWVAMAPVIVAIFATTSRGAVAALAASALVALAIHALLGRLNGKHAVGAAVVALAVLAGVSVAGYDGIASRVGQLGSADLSEFDSASPRRMIWRANAAAFAESPWLGHGAGSHREVHRRFLEESFPREFTHAESGYVQVASEAGLAGLAVAAFAITLIAWWLFRGVTTADDDHAAETWTAIAAPLAASLVHALVDFVWFVPTLFGATVLLAACALRLGRIQSAEPLASPSTSWRWLRPTAIGLASCAVVTMSIGPAIGAIRWDQYLRTSYTLRSLAAQATDDTGADRVDPHLPAMIADATARSVDQLRRVVEADPTHTRAWLRLAGRLLQKYELESGQLQNPMTAEMLRDASLASGFATIEQTTDWLRRAVGEEAELLLESHNAALNALRLCPMVSEAYLYLATTSELIHAPRPTITELVDQSLATAPHDGRVLFEAGRQLFLLGDMRAAPLWRDAATRHGSHLPKLVAMVASVAPAAAFVADLQPDPRVLGMAIRHYTEHGAPDDLLALVQYSAEQARSATTDSPLDQAHRWRLVGTLYRRLQQFDNAVLACEYADRIAPQRFDIRLELAGSLYGAGRYAEADPHIRWCLARRPDLLYLQHWLAEGAKRRTLVEQNRRARRELKAEIAHQPTVAADPTNEIR